MIEIIPSHEKTFRPDDLTLDPNTGLLTYKGKFDLETGTIFEPQLLFNSTPSPPVEKPMEMPAETIALPKSRYSDGPIPSQGWRNPNYEELRYVYVSDRIIVDHNGVSCGTPGAVSICLGDPDGYMRCMRAHIEQHRADAVYIIHNHTEGDPTPSDGDMAATAYVYRHIPQFHGHVIINSGKYAFIERDGSKYGIFPLPGAEHWIDPLLTPSIDHPLLGQVARDKDRIADWADDLLSVDNHPVLIYLGSKLEVRGLQRAVPKAFFNKADIAGRMPRKLIEFGSNGAVAVLPGKLSDELLDVARELVRSHILWAAVGKSEDGEPFGFAAEMPDPDYLGGRHRSTFVPYYIR